MPTSISSIARATVDQLVGLVVDDGFVAVGAVVALLATGGLATYAADIVPIDTLGVFLFVVVCAFLLASLARAGVAARTEAREAMIEAVTRPGA